MRPSMLAKTFIPTNDDNVKFHLKLTPSKTTKPPKVTIVRKERNQESKEVASFGLDAVVRVEWMTLSQSRSDSVAFTFKTSQSNQIFEQLCEGWITVQGMELVSSLYCSLSARADIYSPFSAVRTREP